MKQTTAQVITVIAAILLFSLESLAQQPAPTPRPEEPATGSITGRVVSDTGQPLAGATIYLRSATGVIGSRTTNTDLEGNFQLNGLNASLYYVNAMAPAYTIETRDPEAPPVYYRIGDSIRLELIRGGVITGTVTNSSGEPVVGVRVRAQSLRDAKGQRLPSFSSIERQTDDRGIYRIYGLYPGTYLVSAGGSSFQVYQIGPYDIDAPTYAPSSTRDNATETVVRGNEETTVDIRYRGESGRRVSGTVKNVGALGATIYLSSAGAGFAPSHSTFIMQDGRGFAIYGVSDGDYEIMAQQAVSPTPGVPGEFMLSEPRQISVRGADVSGLELTVQPLPSVSGTITLEPSKAAECQNKRRPTFAETVVDVVRNTKGDDKTKLPTFSSYTTSSQLKQDGVFNIRNLRDTQYAFVPKFFARYWYVQSISIQSQSKVPVPRGTAAAPQKTDAARNWLSLKPGDRLTGLSITLAEGAASIRGRIAVTEGAKFDENFKVFVVPAERDKADDVLRFSVSTLSVDGTFALNNLAPGRYWVVAQVNVDPELTLEKIKLPNAAESRAKLRRAAEAGKVEVELNPCQNLTDYKLTMGTQ